MLISEMKRTSATLKCVLTHIRRLPEGNVCLTFAFKKNSSMASIASVNECLVLLLALDTKHLNLIGNFWLDHNHGARSIVLPPF